jgi:hypothetical protein
VDTRQSLKMLIGVEGAHAFCVSIFGRVEHLPLAVLASCLVEGQKLAQLISNPALHNVAECICFGRCARGESANLPSTETKKKKLMRSS